MSAYREPTAPPLGPLIEDVRKPAAQRYVLWIPIVIGVVIDLSALVSRPHGEGWLIVALMGILAPSLAILGLLTSRAYRVRIHEDGLVVGDGARARSARWEDIRETLMRPTVSRRNQLAALHFFRLVLADGSSLEFLGAIALRDYIHTRTRTRLMESAKKQLVEGEVRFGEVVVDASGVRRAETRLGWASIARATSDGQTHSIVIRGPGSSWIEAPIAEVPNTHVLIDLVNERATGGEAP